eukprot:10113137-Ditylum_brightwellii.AAC.1
MMVWMDIGDVDPMYNMEGLSPNIKTFVKPNGLTFGTIFLLVICKKKGVGIGICTVKAVLAGLHENRKFHLNEVEDGLDTWFLWHSILATRKRRLTRIEQAP